MNTYAQSRNVSIGPAASWDFANLYDKAEVIGDHAPEEDDLGPPYDITSRYTPGGTTRRGSVFAESSRSADMRSQTPIPRHTPRQGSRYASRQPVQHYSNHQEDLEPEDMMSYTREEDRGRARSRPQDDPHRSNSARATSIHHISPHRQHMREASRAPVSYMANPMLPPSTARSALPASNTMKRFGTPMTGPPSKRHQMSSDDEYANTVYGNRAGSADRVYVDQIRNATNASNPTMGFYYDQQREMESRVSPNLRQAQQQVFHNQDPFQVQNPRMSRIPSQRSVNGYSQNSPRSSSQGRPSTSKLFREETFVPSGRHARTPGPTLLSAQYQEDDMMTDGYNSNQFHFGEMGPSTIKFRRGNTAKSSERGESAASKPRNSYDTYQSPLADTRNASERSSPPRTPPNMSRPRKALKKDKTARANLMPSFKMGSNPKYASANQEIQSPRHQTPDPRQTTPSARRPVNMQPETLAIDDSDDEEETPMNEMLARKRAKNAAAKRQRPSKTVNPLTINDFQYENSHFPSSKSQIGFNDSGFFSQASNANAKESQNGYQAGFSETQGSAAESTQPTLQNEDVIDLVTPEFKPISRSMPMKERMTPAKKLIPKKEKSSTPRVRKTQSASIDLTTPKKVGRPGKPKPGNEEIEEDPGFERQRRAAETIEQIQQEAERVQREKALFGEADAESEEAKEKRARDEKQREKEAKKKRLEMLLKKEQARTAKEEKKRQLEAEALERKEREAEEKRQKQIRLEAKRNEDKEAEKMRTEENRRAVVARIEAERAETARKEAENKLLNDEEVKKAAATQEAAENVAKLKAQKEEAKKQASSLSAKKNPFVEKQPEVSLPTPIPAPVDQSVNEDIPMEDAEDEEESLFMPQSPSKPEVSITQQLSNTATVSTPSQVQLAQIRQKTQDQKNDKEEQARKTKAMSAARMKQRAIDAAETPTKRPVKKNARAPKSSPFIQESDDEGEDFAVRTSKPAVPLASRLFAPDKHVAEPDTDNDEDPFEWVDGDRSQPGAHQNIANKSQSQSQSHTAPSSRNTFSSSRDTVQDENMDDDPEPASPAFDAKLLQLYRKGHVQRNGKDAPRKRPPVSTKSEGLTEAQIRGRQKAADLRTQKAGEKHRTEILTKARNNGIILSENDVNAAVELFLEKRAAELQRRYARKSEQARRRKTGPAEAMRKSGQLDNNSRRNSVSSSVTHSTQNENLLDDESDEDEEVDYEAEMEADLLAELNKSSEDDNNNANKISRPEAEFELQHNGSEIGVDRRDSIPCVSSGAVTKTTPLHPSKALPPPRVLATFRKNSALSSAVSPHKFSSLLSKNVLLDTPSTINPNNMSSPSHPRELILVNVYQVKQTRINSTKAGYSTKTHLLDNYGMLIHANERIRLEYTKMLNSKLQIESSENRKNELGHEHVEVILENEKDSSVEIFIEVVPRLENTLSGFDPKLFEPTVRTKIYAVVQHLTRKDTREMEEITASFEEVVVEYEVVEVAAEAMEVTEDENANAADDQLMEGMATTEPEKRVTSSGSQEVATTAEEPKRNAEEAGLDDQAVDALYGDADEPATEPQLEAEPEPKPVTPFVPVALRRALNSPSPSSDSDSDSDSNPPFRSPSPVPEADTSYETEASLPPPLESETTILDDGFTNLEMANVFACTTLIALTKPPGSKIDHLMTHSELSKQAREAMDDLRTRGGKFDISVEGDQLPWLEWESVQVFVKDLSVRGPGRTNV